MKCRYQLGQYVVPTHGDYAGETGLVISRWKREDTIHYTVVLLTAPRVERLGADMFRREIIVEDHLRLVGVAGVAR